MAYLNFVFENGIVILVCIFVILFESVLKICGSLWIYTLCLAPLYICFQSLSRYMHGHIVANGKGVLVTGCDTGFGHDAARRLVELGFTVFAGCLHPEGTGARKLKDGLSGRLHIVPLDVTSDESVQQAHDYVFKNLPDAGLWGIVNNAGIFVHGDIDFLTLDLYRKAIEVNLNGPIRVVRTFMSMIKKTAGRVVNVSSVRGRFPLPNSAAYGVSKYGIEVWSDILRLEMIKFGVKVAIVEPGSFGLATAIASPELLKRYSAECDLMWEAASDGVRETYGKEYFRRDIKPSNTSSKRQTTKPVVEAFVDALLSPKPKTRYLVYGGVDQLDTHAVLAQYSWVLPTWLLDWIIIRSTRCDRLPS